MIKETRLPIDCANLECPNKSYQGTFILLETEKALIGDFRKLRLWLCAPCARAVSDLINRIKT